FTRLQPALIPAEDPQEFVSQRNETARNLAQTDALRLLLSFSRLLPTSNVVEPIPEPENPDRMLHVRAQGRKLGMFDLYYDSGAAEQVWAGQLKSVGGVNYYDVRSEEVGGLVYVGARGTWYPNRGLGMSNYDLEFRYPADWVLVATGKRTDPGSSKSADQIAGLQVSRWVSERPIPLAGFNLGKYSRVETQIGDVKVETYAASGVERSFPKGTEIAEVPGPVIPSGLR